ncbi:MAG: 50S ribosomal protein L18 [Verrucomicrobia bacterium]|nr:50S ribosomal protein L18 [Verrucomicrobiota bacterium]MBI3869475.1 50S ribosomal protein L18 [Verrucomicrobiota bacterium]
MQNKKKNRLLQLRKYRIRNRVSGTQARPRLSVKFSGQHIYVQFVDDFKRVTLASATTRTKDTAGKMKANVAGATELGKIAAEKALAAGIKRVVFDRNGLRYHGKVKALADAARQGGLEF